MTATSHLRGIEKVSDGWCGTTYRLLYPNGVHHEEHAARQGAPRSDEGCGHQERDEDEGCGQGGTEAEEANRDDGQTLAIASAKQYLQLQGFSKKGLIKQLSSKYGEGFSKADAEYAVNHITVDWNAQAVRAAKEYLKTQPMSQAALVKQLESPYGEQFTHAQAVHGANIAYASR